MSIVISIVCSVHVQHWLGVGPKPYLSVVDMQLSFTEHNRHVPTVVFDTSHIITCMTSMKQKIVFIIIIIIIVTQPVAKLVQIYVYNILHLLRIAETNLQLL